MKTNVIQLAARYDRAMASWRRAADAESEAFHASPYNKRYHDRCQKITDRLWIRAYPLGEKLYQIRNQTS